MTTRDEIEDSKGTDCQDVEVQNWEPLQPCVSKECPSVKDDTSCVIVDSESYFCFRSVSSRSANKPLQSETPTSFDGVEWVKTDAVLTGGTGDVVFEQRGIRAPRAWTQAAVSIFAARYLRQSKGAPDRESDIEQAATRVVSALTKWGIAQKYFFSNAEAHSFFWNIFELLVYQKACFSSPFWFNIDVNAGPTEGYYYNCANDCVKTIDKSRPMPQCAASFILGVKDSIDAVLDTAKAEAMLFKWGAGTGSNLSALRENNAPLNGGGRSCGPITFMRALDAMAGCHDNCGHTRRAAKMVLLDIDHPDIEQFIWSKAAEERRLRFLQTAPKMIEIEQPYPGFFQNANHSVRIGDDFMAAVTTGEPWFTSSVLSHESIKRFDAKQLLVDLATAAWECGDPGVQFVDTINRWNTCKVTSRINGSNACAEFMLVDNSACFLATINLLSFLKPNGIFAVDAFSSAIALLIKALDMAVDNSSYPTYEIAENTHRYRPLALGLTNLGALLMCLGYSYDSPEARAFAGALTALLTGLSYSASAHLAKTLGPCDAFKTNSDSFLEVICEHRRSLDMLDESLLPSVIVRASRQAWDSAHQLGMDYGYRNAHVTAIAPNGTTSLVMDCATTGIEPELALVKQKRLAGGAMLNVINHAVPLALKNLGYSPEGINIILKYVKTTGTIEGAPGLIDEHLPVFDCSLPVAGSRRTIHYLGHLRMMAAIQPFLSGAISKTINLPSDSAVSDVVNIYEQAWRLGLKAISIYRDGTKPLQPLNPSSQVTRTRSL